MSAINNSKPLAGVFSLVLLVFTVAAFSQSERNLIPGGDFETGPEPRYLAGDNYHKNLIRNGWDFKMAGPLFWPMPLFTPNGGKAKVRWVKITDAYEGKGCLFVETAKESCSAYCSDLIVPGFNYLLEFAASGTGEIIFSAYVYGRKGMIKSPVFITVKLTEEWQVYKIPVSITDPEANIGSLVLNVHPKTQLWLDNLVFIKK